MFVILSAAVLLASALPWIACAVAAADANTDCARACECKAGEAITFTLADKGARGIFKLPIAAAGYVRVSVPKTGIDWLKFEVPEAGYLRFTHGPTGVAGLNPFAEFADELLKPLGAQGSAHVNGPCPVFAKITGQESAGLPPRNITILLHPAIFAVALPDEISPARPCLCPAACGGGLAVHRRDAVGCHGFSRFARRGEA